MGNERYTFSSLLNKMMEVEHTLHDILTPFVEESNSDISKKLLTYLGLMEKRVSDIQWVKDFVVVEMTLEPITGLEIDDKLQEIRLIIEDRNTPLDGRLLKIVRIVAELYEEVSEKLRYISIEASDLFVQFKEDLLSLFPISHAN